jgi:electron transfer flavoprotein alpha subunit
LTATDDSLENPYGQSIASISKGLVEANGYTNVIAASSSFGKDVIPRIGGLLDLQPITDVVAIKEGPKFVRPIYAGNALCTVSSSDVIKLLTVRGTNFEKVLPGDQADSSVEEVSGVADIVADQQGKWVENIVSESDSADLTTAKYVVSGGRAMKTSENFSLLTDIAETLGKGDCAIGASRAAVDAGMCPNDM